MKSVFCLGFAIIVAALPAFAVDPATSVARDTVAATSSELRQTLSLDQGWRFHLGDIPLTAFGDSGGLAFGPPDLSDSDGKTGATWARRPRILMTKAGAFWICRMIG